MYTQCPDCQTAFQVTAKVLQQAGGKVRCGGCSNAFNALDYLSEDLPESPLDEQQALGNEPAGEVVGDEEFAEQTNALLETLDELAGPDDVRIEDTGVEWRVLDEVVSEAQQPGNSDDTASFPVFSGDAVVERLTDRVDVSNDAADTPAKKSAAIEPAEMRFDDNTPLPDDFDDLPEPQAAPQRRTDDHIEAQQKLVDEMQEDLELGEPDDWEHLLDEVEINISEDGAVVTMEVEGDPVERDTAIADADQPDDESPTTDIPLYVESDSVEAESDTGVYAPDDAETASAEDSDVEEIYAAAAEEEEAEAEAEAEEATEAEFQEDDFAESDDELARAKSLRESTGSFEQQIATAASDLYRQLESDDESESGKSIAVENIIEDDTPEESPDDAPVDAPDDAADHALQLAAGDDEEPPETEFAVDAGTGAEEDESVSAAAEEEDASTVDDDVPEQELASKDESEEEVEDQMEATIAGVPTSLLKENGGNVETIIMEGEFVRGSIEKQRRAEDHASAASLDDPVSLVDTYAIQRGQSRAGRRRGDPLSARAVTVIAILAVVLVGQLLHANREALSTYGAFNQTLGPVYRMVGNPVTPAWDIKGWRFEATNGATDEEERVLTILSRIINRSDQPLPYPLVHVSLTDRWEEIIGSRVLEPNEYLAGDLDPSKPVAAGENFTAVITVASPSTDATGFKLNVCYRVSPGTVRCATEDFKE